MLLPEYPEYSQTPGNLLLKKQLTPEGKFQMARINTAEFLKCYVDDLVDFMVLATYYTSVAFFFLRMFFGGEI